MLTIAGAVNNAAYYMDKDNYYFLGNMESKWLGKGAEALGLDGPVQEADFARVLEGRLPGGNDLSRMSGGKNTHRPGYDLTLSAPKSVSVMAVVLGDSRFLEAHEASVREAAEEIEKLASTRVMTDGVSQTVGTGNLVMAAFNHDTSRELEPQVHTHLVVLNATAHEGEWKTLATDTVRKTGFSDNVYALQVALGKVYRNGMRQRVEEMGFKTRDAGKNGLWEMEGVPVEVFSGRSAQIREAAGEDASLKARDIAALSTRRRKEKEPDRDSLLTDWMQRLDDNGFDPKAFREQAEQRRQTQDVASTATRLPAPEEVKKAVGEAISLLSEQRTRFTYSDVLNRTLNGLDGRQDVALMARQAIEESIKAQQLIPLDKEKGLFTSAIHLMDELSLQQVASELKGSVTVPVLASGAQPDTPAMQTVARERPAVAIISRPGGAQALRDGVEEAVNMAQGQGRTVSVLATDLAASRWLEKASPDLPVSGLKDLLTGEGQPLQPGSTLVIAGAEKLSVRDALTVTDMALRAKAQLLFVDNGGRGGTGNALNTLEEAGVTRYDGAPVSTVAVSVSTVADRRQRHDALAQEYVALSQRGENVVAQASGERERQALTGRIRETLREQGVLGEENSRTVDTLTPLWLDGKSRRQVDTYREGMVLEQRSENSRFPVRYTIDRVGQDTRTLRLKDEKGKLHPLKLSEVDSSWSLYQAQKADVAEGEVLTWRARQGKLRSGDTVTVTKVHKAALEVEKDGQTLMIYTDTPVKAEYGYVSAAGSRVSDSGIVLAAVSAKETAAPLLNTLSRSGAEVRVFTPLAQDEATRRLAKSPHYSTALRQVNPEGRDLSPALDAAQDALMPAVEKAVRQAITLTQGSEVVFSRLDVLANATPLYPGLSKDAADQELSRQIKAGELISVPGVKGALQQLYVTASTYEAEKRLIQLVAEGLDTQQPLMRDADDALLAGLTPGQQAASRLMLESPDRFIAVQGYAGTGKTTQLKSVLGALDTLPDAQKPDVVGLAPTHRAVGEMAAVGVKAQTLASFLMDTERRMADGEALDYRNTLFLVDESSMVGNRDFADALSRIAAGGGRAVLSGDRDQLLPVANGAPFGLLQSRSALDTAIMKDIVRQTPALKPAIYAMTERNVAAAISTVGSVSPDLVARAAGHWSPSYSVMEIKQSKKEKENDGDRVIAAIVDDYSSRTAQAREETLIVTQTNADKDAINAGIHADLQKRGALGREATVPVLVRVKTQADRLKSVAGMAEQSGNLALINDRYYTIRAVADGNEQGIVELVDDTGRAQALSAFESSLRDIAVYRKTSIPVSVGEKVSFSRSDKERGREVNSSWTVSGVTKAGDLELTQGSETRLLNPREDLNDRHLDYGYAGTAHKAQGASSPYVILLAGTDGGRKMLASMRDAYVGLSRVKTHVQLYTDNLSKWKDTVTASRDRQTAHDVLHAESDRSATVAQSVWEKAKPLADTALGRALTRDGGPSGEARLVAATRKYPNPHVAWPAYDGAGKLQGVLLSEVRLSAEGYLDGISDKTRQLGSDTATLVVVQRSENGITQVADNLYAARQLAAADPDSGVVVASGEVPKDRILRNVTGGAPLPPVPPEPEAPLQADIPDPHTLKTPEELQTEKAIEEEQRRQATTKETLSPADVEKALSGDTDPLAEQALSREFSREAQREERQLERETEKGVAQLKQDHQQEQLRNMEREIVKEKTLGES